MSTQDCVFYLQRIARQLETLIKIPNQIPKLKVRFSPNVSYSTNPFYLNRPPLSHIVIKQIIDNQIELLKHSLFLSVTEFANLPTLYRERPSPSIHTKYFQAIRDRSGFIIHKTQFNNSVTSRRSFTSHNVAKH